MLFTEKLKIAHPALPFESSTCQNGGLLCNIADKGNHHQR